MKTKLFCKLIMCTGLFTIIIFGSIPIMAKPAQLEPDQCIDLRRGLHNKVVELKKQKDIYNKWQSEFDKFYEDSKIDMQVVYEERSWKFVLPIPFVSDIEINKPVAITKGVQYMPKVRLTSPVSSRSSTLKFLAEMEKLANVVAFVGGPAAAAAVATFTSAFTKLTDKLTDYEEALKIHEQYTRSRKTMLGNYSKVLTAYYCEEVLPIEANILRIRDQDLENSDCSFNEKQVVITEVTRSSNIRNMTHLDTALRYCESYTTPSDTSEMKRFAGLFASMTCMAANPEYWKNTLKDKSAAEHRRAEIESERRMQRLYAKYDYKGEKEAELSAKKFMGRAPFKKMVLENISGSCVIPDSVRKGLEKTLSQPLK